MTTKAREHDVADIGLAGAGERMGSTLSSFVAFMILPISAGKAETMRSRGVAQTPDGAPVAPWAAAGTPTNNKTVATRTAIRRIAPLPASPTTSTDRFAAPARPVRQRAAAPPSSSRRTRRSSLPVSV